MFSLLILNNFKNFDAFKITKQVQKFLVTRQHIVNAVYYSRLQIKRFSYILTLSPIKHE